MHLRMMLIGAHTLANPEVLIQHRMAIRELMDRMALLNTIMTIMTTEDRINIRMILMVVIITIGNTVLGGQHTALDGRLLQEQYW